MCYLFWFQDALNSCIHQKLPHLLSGGSVKLVIIDSVAALFRCDYELKDMYRRSKHMASLAASLQQLSSKYCLPIVCVNQVCGNHSCSQINGVWSPKRAKIKFVYFSFSIKPPRPLHTLINHDTIHVYIVYIVWISQ